MDPQPSGPWPPTPPVASPPPSAPPMQLPTGQWLPASPLMASPAGAPWPPTPMAPPAAINVTVLATVATEIEPAATYTAKFSAGGVDLGAWPPIRFSALNKAHGSLPSGACVYPEFPSLYIFSNMKTDMDNVTRRGSEVAAYLAALLRCPAPIVVPSLARAGLPLPPAVTAQVEALHAHAMAVAEAAAAAARAAAEERQRRERADAAAVHAAAAHASGLAYPQPMAFTLRSKFWANGGADIQGPGNLLFFRLARANMALFGDFFRNAAFSLTTAAGAPLVHLQEQFAWLCYEYNVARHNPAGGPPLHMCTVRGRHVWAADVFEIDAVGGVYQVVGTWMMDLGRPFAILLNGAEVARVEKHAFSLTDTYTVIIAAGADTLMLMAILVAVERIHHEIEEKHRRQQQQRTEEQIAFNVIANAASHGHHYRHGGHHHHHHNHGHNR